MITAGIIAEYNPFHNGHSYHISETRRISGAEKVIAVMSGSFVQRGEPACADKFTRAAWAIRGGADMVLELPDVYSISCAERFASGAVRLMKATGLVDLLSFGSESGDKERLITSAFADFDEEAFDRAIGKGLSYPAAMETASGSMLKPNDILGTEYIRANKKYSCGFEIFPVKRDSDYNSYELGGDYSSAYAIRLALSREISGIRMSPSVFDGLMKALPKDELEEMLGLSKSGRFPASVENLSDIVLYKLRSMNKDGIAALPEVSEGLENLFKRYSEECGEYSRMLNMIKSKRYTMARLKRIVMCAVLGITAELQDEAFANDSSLYIRVLAIKKDSLDLLGELTEIASVPVIVRYSDREKLSPSGQKIEEISSYAHAIRSLAQPYDKSFVPDGSYKLIVI